ncbi:hypothetical protein BKA66DRAFT_441799 [Pyrenochaeta sp. MPI-SDFR-AT-0127]|nr:hypothetical protein BKA66DRAFT_441799 [Pyrenochaeta sp. MPI-SDFR-AT-0127]
MSTHFRPRPATTAPTSPVRPSTARSTVRAVTPSPPDSLDRAFKPNFSQSDMSFTQEDERFSSCRFWPRDEEPCTNNMESKGNSELVISPASGCVRGDMSSRPSSLVKGRERSRSPKKRPSLIPTKVSPHQESQAKDPRGAEEMNNEIIAMKEIHEEDEVEEEQKRPDTPTPISRSQQRSAYVPLGAPAGLFVQNENEKLEGVYARSRQSRKTFRTARAHKAISSAPPTLGAQPEPLSLQRPTYRRPEFSISPQATSMAVLRKPVPLSGPGKHISVSGQSNLSGGTIASKHSIFSTPGRDELERNKALVEPDQGPFSRATTMADLQERRRRISEGTLKEQKGNWCQIGCPNCNVM